MFEALSSLTASGLAVKPTLPPKSFFKFPPASDPAALPPPLDHPTIEHPFTVPSEIYNGLLQVEVPITVAAIYIVFVTYMNSLNARRKYKPWAFSHTSLFKLLVILHNIFLAVYSGWTFIGMVNAVRNSFADWREYGLAASVDSLCKLHGPRGYGDAATFDATSSAWGLTNRLLHLAADGLTPETTDVGRIWNEGLAFYGWLFYLSKFYEVVDTAIILAKGKKSSFLQTYHHAGAMLCMWAGIRYMSPPIWMFVLVNSFIHTIMYTFYLCSAIGVKVPKWFKQTLTTMQITQFVVGASYAFAHLFVAYQIPVKVPFIYHLEDAVSSMVSALPSDASSAGSAALATASAGVGSWLKKLAFRAAGREGLAENVLNEQGRTFDVNAARPVRDFAKKQETRYRDEMHWVNCLDTSGQAFAIYLNCMYLAPLTWLFLRFFVKSYLRRVERRRSSAASEKARIAGRSLSDASKGVARQVKEVVEELREATEEVGDDSGLFDSEDFQRQAQEIQARAQQKIREGIEKTKETYQKMDRETLRQEIKGDLDKLRQNLKETGEKVHQKVEHTSTSQSTSQSTRTEEFSSSTTMNRWTEQSEPEQEDAKPSTPNGIGTGAGEATGQPQTQSQEAKQEALEKKEEDKIIEQSLPVREDDISPKSGSPVKVNRERRKG